MRALVITAVLTTLTTGCCHAGAPRADASDPGAPTRRAIPGEYVFTVSPGTTPAALQGTFADLAPRRIQDLGGNRILVVFRDDPGLSRLSFRLGDGRLLDVQPNFTYSATPAR
jgi:hypothetical protein